MDKTQKNSAKMQRTGVTADQHEEEENRNPTSSWIPKERVSLLAILDLHQDLISETAPDSNKKRRQVICRKIGDFARKTRHRLRFCVGNQKATNPKSSNPAPVRVTTVHNVDLIPYILLQEQRQHMSVK